MSVYKNKLSISRVDSFAEYILKKCVIFHNNSANKWYSRFAYILLQLGKIPCVLFNMPTSIHIARLLASPKMHIITKEKPDIYKKLFTAKYLADFFSHRNRVSILLQNYSIINTAFSLAAVERIAKDRIIIWENIGTSTLRVNLELNALKNHAEGDLYLSFEANNTTIFVLSFTFIPGTALSDPPDSPTLFVARLQGVKGQHKLIHQATKQMDEISPFAILLLGAQAIAQSCGIFKIVGIAEAYQICNTPDTKQEFTFDYNEFWIANGGIPVENHYFTLSAHPYEKPITEVPRWHRSRTHKKRNLRKKILQEMIESFNLQCEKGAKSGGSGTGGTRVVLNETGQQILS